MKALVIIILFGMWVYHIFLCIEAIDTTDDDGAGEHILDNHLEH